MYAFPSYASVYGKAPYLNISNCDFEYFMDGYQSLINVERDNL